MQNKFFSTTHQRTLLRRSALTSVVILFLLLQATPISYAVTQQSQEGAQQSQEAKPGSVRIWMGPGSYPILVDGRPAGKTNPGPALSLKLQRTTHTIEIQLPNHQRWKKQVNLASDDSVCINLHYYTPTDPALGGLPPARERGEHAENYVDIIFSDGARLTGDYRCKLGSALPRVPLGSKKSSRKAARKTNP